MIRDRLDDVLRGLLLLACVAGIMIVVMLLDSVAFSILVIGGAALAAFAGHRLSRGRASLDWPRTTGTISTTRIAERSVADSGHMRRTYFYPEIEFTYALDGRERSSARVALDPKSVWSPDRRTVEALVADLVPDARVTVYVDPRRPDLAVVFPGLSAQRRSHYVAVTLAGLLIAAAGVGVWRLTVAAL